MSENDIKIYHVETQEDYDDLMVKLEEQGYKWLNGDKPTSVNYWISSREETVIYLNENAFYTMTRDFMSALKNNHPDRNIIKHKAKGAKQMEKVVVPQFVADYIDKQYGGNKPNIEDKAELIRDWDRYVVSCGDFKLEEWVDDDTNFLTFVIAIATNDYEVEKEKKYYWRKKKEYMFDFEDDDYIYLNIDEDTGEIYFSDKENFNNFKTLLTETELKQFVREEDFNKLEKVEIKE